MTTRLDNSGRPSRRTRLGAITIAASFLGLGIAVGATTPDAGPQEDPAGAMTSDQQKMMEAQMAYATPGAPHQELAARAGDWTTELAYWPAPGAPKMSTTGHSHVASIWDGRYIVEHFTCNWMGEPFEGRGVTGFDNIKQKYVTVWIDSMATGIMQSEGTAVGAGAKHVKYEGKMPDFMNGGYKSVRSEEIVDSATRRRMVMYDTTPDGTEYKSMEITYTRATKQ